jgi:hypothetical protein
MPQFLPTTRCRQKSSECEEFARLVFDENLTPLYRELAFQWRQMAEMAERLERKRLASAISQKEGRRDCHYDGARKPALHHLEGLGLPRSRVGLAVINECGSDHCRSLLAPARQHVGADDTAAGANP